MWPAVKQKDNLLSKLLFFVIFFPSKSHWLPHKTSLFHELTVASLISALPESQMQASGRSYSDPCCICISH